jgi:hypothetical protein
MIARSPTSKLILVTALSPTPAGEGKTTTSIGLNEGLNKLGKKSIVVLREPSLGPVFGMKGGAAGGGYAQVVPMEDINLHFTGDFSSHREGQQPARRAHRQQPAEPQTFAGHRSAHHRLEARDGHERPRPARHHHRPGRHRQRHSPRRTASTSRPPARSWPSSASPPASRTSRTASATSTWARRWDRTPVYARDLKAEAAMAILLKDAIKPNLVQTLERQPRHPARRSLRQHRTGREQRAGHQDGPEPRRLRGDRGRLRRRPRCREVLRHQVPRGGPEAQRRGDRGHGARAALPRRCRCEGGEHRRAGQAQGRAWPTWAATSRTWPSSA